MLVRGLEIGFRFGENRLIRLGLVEGRFRAVDVFLCVVDSTIEDRDASERQILKGARAVGGELAKVLAGGGLRRASIFAAPPPAGPPPLLRPLSRALSWPRPQ